MRKKIASFAKMLFVQPFCISYPVLLLEVDVENWITIPNLVIRNTTCISVFKKIVSTLWP